MKVGTTEIISLLGIAGTLLGTLAGTGLQFVIERRRWRREDQVRFRNDLYNACLAFFYHANTAIIRLSNRGDSESQDSEIAGPLIPHLQELLVNRSRIAMLGSKSLNDAAFRFHAVADKLDQGAPFTAAIKREYDEARTAFIDEVRKELSVEIQL